MPLPNLIDVLRVQPMKKVIKASKASEKVEELTKKDTVKQRPASEVRKKLYGEKK